MEVVKFQCGHCGKLMAVRVGDLGMHVRCPHCRQTVQAPQPEPSPLLPAEGGSRLEDRGSKEAPSSSILDPQTTLQASAGEQLPEIRIAALADGESIFTPPEESGDDLFGAPAGPRVELPPELGLPDLEISRFVSAASEVVIVPEAPPELVIAAPPVPGTGPEPPPSSEATVSYFGAPPPPADFAGQPQPDLAEPPVEPTPAEPTPTRVDSPLAFTSAPPSQPIEIPPQEGLALEPVTAGLPTAPVRRPRDRGVLGILLLMFLIPYALVMTAAVGWLLYQQRKTAPFDPLERLPDPDPTKGGPQRVKFDARLPDKLKIPLHQPIQVGDIEVIPLAVERVEERPNQMLTLKLRFRNLSKNTAFDPLPQAFVTYGAKSSEMKPYTFLKVEDSAAYGGYVEPVTMPQRKGPPSGVLYPDEQAVVKLRTYPRYTKVIQRLDRYRGEVLWRVQVRRGFVPVQGKDVSATAVIGVRIDSSAIPRPEPQDARLSPPAGFSSLFCTFTPNNHCLLSLHFYNTIW
ncbi:MAG: hypothetical protein L0Z62_16995 [Gemmataceae bacterium]|nr:hypothetical protein [Gemmataceae bacterium]